MILHGFFHKVAVDRDLRMNQLAEARSRETLVHKAKAIAALKSHLSMPLLDSEAIDVALVAILIIGKSDMDNSIMSKMSLASTAQHFDPPLTSPEVTVYGRIDMANAHLQVVQALIKRVGGLQNIRIPGIAHSLGRYVTPDCRSTSL